MTPSEVVTTLRSLGYTTANLGIGGVYLLPCDGLLVNVSVGGRRNADKRCSRLSAWNELDGDSAPWVDRPVSDMLEVVALIEHTIQRYKAGDRSQEIIPDY